MKKVWHNSLILSLLLLGLNTPLFAKNTSELIYTEPFDLAAGGTTLTRASQEGIVFANPALLPLGAANIRWLGLQTGIMVDRKLAEKGTFDIGGAAGTGEDNFVDQLFDSSLHFGQTTTLSFLNQYFAITAFERAEIDVEGSRYGNGGLPQIEFGGEAYAGAMLTGAYRPFRWLSLGVTQKYLYMTEPDIDIPVTDEVAIRRLIDNPETILDDLTFGQGIGVDLGALLLWQNPLVDLSLGLKVEDVGDTSLTADKPSLKQTYNAGLGVAIHGTTNVLHLSLDYRDLAGAYEEATFKRVYLGARLLLEQHFGLAVGLYQGIPTAGIRLDLWLLKLGVSVYGRELGDYPGDRQRNMIVLYTSFGF